MKRSCFRITIMQAGAQACAVLGAARAAARAATRAATPATLPVTLSTLAVLLFAHGAQASEVTEADAREARMEVAEACTRPEAPNVPDGATAETEEMVEAGSAVREFVSGTRDYLACLERKEVAYGADITPAQQAVIVAIYNQSVDAMQRTADRFNTELGEFRAREH